VRLRPLRASDLQTLSAWVPHAADAAGCDQFTQDKLHTLTEREETLVGSEDGVCAFVSFRVNQKARGVAEVIFLTVEPVRRRRGLGGRVVLALERRLRDRAREVRACVPARTGIAFYFWLRLGYRPLPRAAWPRRKDIEPTAWLVRRLS
jgi:ribosomal protein S18 acetylase RimI-like enzyme